MTLETIARPDGKTCPVYVANPTGAPKGGLVVIQEWWGLNEQIKKTADRFAALGYRALVPDLFRGKVTKDSAEANHLMSGLDFVDAADQDVRGAVEHLAKAGLKVGVTGFCMGGALTLMAAARIPTLSAGVCFYGIPPEKAFDPSGIRAPLQCHFAEHDDWCTPEAVAALEKRLAGAGVKLELYRYDAQHAFMNEQRPEVYAPEAAKLAWERATTFFERTLA